MRNLIEFNERNLKFDGSMESHHLKISNKFGLEVPGLKIKANMVYFDDLAPGSYQVQWGGGGYYHLEIISIEKDDLLPT